MKIDIKQRFFTTQEKVMVIYRYVYNSNKKNPIEICFSNHVLLSLPVIVVFYGLAYINKYIYRIYRI